MPPNPKRRKTAPRKLGSFLSSSPAHEPFSPVEDEDMAGDTEKENKSLLSLALTAKDINNISLSYNNRRHSNNLAAATANGPASIAEIKSEVSPPTARLEAHNPRGGAYFKLERRGSEAGTVADVTPPEGTPMAALNLSAAHQLYGPTHHEQKMFKQKSGLEDEVDEELQSLDLTTAKSNNSSSSSSFSQTFQLLPSQLLAAAAASSSPASLSLMGGEGLRSADQLVTMLNPDQMAALLGPSWKSRQPMMCQYCQRMFSNKFNLKQHVLNMHTVGREMQCEICNKKVKNKWYLRRHHVTHHGAPLKK